MIPLYTANTHVNMESCLKSLPRKSYNTFGVVFIISFVSIGIVLIAIASGFESKATLQCNPDKSLASDLSTRKFIDTQCFLKYAQEFLPSLPLHVLVVINFGLVFLFNVIYAISVKHRVEIFANPPSPTTISAEDESQPLSGISQAATDPMAYQNCRPIVFTVYIMHLILCRIIPLVIFAALLLTSSNFPVQFHCPWPIQTTSTSHANFTQSQTTNHSIVDCSFPMGSKNEKLVSTVVIANILFGTVTFMELAYLLWSTWKDRSLCTDMEFCCVYLLRKRKRIRKLIKKIREKIPDDFFRLHDDFGEKRLSRRKLEDIYVNVIIQRGRAWISSRTFKNRHETYEAHFKAPADATILKTTADLFKPIDACNKRPRTILVVGRPGIGKTLLTKKLFYEWQQRISEFWHGKIVILIRFRAFNKGETSLREMLRHSDGLNMSSADFNGVYEYMCLFPSNHIVVFDGLDELKVNNESLAEEKDCKQSQ